MKSIPKILQQLQTSRFRRKFQLSDADINYLHNKGMEAVLFHGKQFILDRLSAANPKNDGKQTPFRGHPIFIAQHATATCCRGCLQKWHGIAMGNALEENEQAYILSVLERWIQNQLVELHQENGPEILF